MKIFFDFEFTGLHQHTTIISLGMVSENGKRFLAETDSYDKTQVDDWIDEHVIPNLYISKDVDEMPTDCTYIVCKDIKEMGQKAKRWLAQFNMAEMWGDCLAYDWVLFCEMYGGALSIPANVYYIPFDICTLMELKGQDSDENREVLAGFPDTKTKHNALHDANIIKLCYEKLIEIPYP